MEYAQHTSAPIRKVETLENTARPADLPTLMNMLEEQVRRARSLSERANNLGDMVFGSRPACDSACPPEPPATLESLVSKLTEALTDIDIALSRL